MATAVGIALGSNLGDKLAHLREAQSDVDAPDTAPDLPNASRTEQLAEIREMLAEVQAEESAATKADPGSSAGSAASPSHQEARAPCARAPISGASTG